jgi:hypothetical protein
VFNINEYKDKINNFFEIMLENENIVNIKLSEEKWTLKEMVGHLIDSASNNHQRFIRLQIDKKLVFPIFREEDWKSVTKIKEYNFLELINLWKGYNNLLLYIIQNINESDYNNIWEWEGIGKEWTLKFTIEDYFGEHMDWHIDLYKNRIEEIKNKQI